MNPNISPGDWMLLLFLGSSSVGVISHYIAGVILGTGKSKEELYQATSKRLELIEKENKDQQLQLDVQKKEIDGLTKQNNQASMQIQLDEAIIENRNPELERALGELLTLGGQTLSAVVELQKLLLTQGIKQGQLTEETQVN